MKRASIAVLVLLAAGLTAAAFITGSCADEPCGGHAIAIEAGDLRAVFADNGEFEGHRAWYNGVASLRHAADTTTLFRPRVAGLNFEHIYDGQKWWEPVEALFEPRDSPMEITRAGENSVELHQPPTKLHKLESWTRFTVEAPHYIDMEFRCIPRAETFERGYIGLFWASYINTETGKEYYFIGRKPGETENRWLAYISPEHNENSTVRYINDERDPTFVDEYPRRLFNDYFEYRYAYPFYYGRRGEMVYILMFDQAGPVRFSHSPSSGGPVRPGATPAWDWQYLIHDYEVGREYGYRARLVYKPYVSGEDIIAEYEKWSGEKVEIE